MTDTALAPDPALFSRNDKPGEYTAEISVRGIISISLKADSPEDAKRQAEAELERIENDGYAEIDNIGEIDLRRLTKDKPMYRVMRDGQRMQVSHLEAGDTPREPDPERGF